MPPLQGLIFDLDGTLIDSAPDLRQALNATLKTHGRKSLPLETIKGFTGDGMMPMIARAFAATGTPLPESETYKVFQQFITHYRNLGPDPEQVFAGAVEAIMDFRKSGVKIGICTNKQELATTQLLEDLGINPLFDFVAGGDTFPVHKPHPDHVRGVISRLGVPTENCVMVGDGPNDVNAAHAAGIPCIVVTHGYSQDYDRLGGDVLIGGFGELSAALTKLGFSV